MPRKKAAQEISGKRGRRKKDLTKIDADVTILMTLLEEAPSFVSGSLLSNRLRISRVGIWSRLSKLRKDGFRLFAVRNRGYCLDKEPIQIHPRLLEAYIRVQKYKCPKIIVQKSAESTNAEASKLLANGEVAPFVFIANKQTKGRGRYGKTWVSKDPRNLYLSMGFRPQIKSSRLNLFTLWIGVNICRLLEDETGLPIKIKWPNDIYIDGKKLAGMLTEAHIDTDSIRNLIFGLGLNINSTEKKMPGVVDNKPTSLALELGKNVSHHLLTAKIIQTIRLAYEACIEEDIHKELVTQWKQYDYLYGKNVIADEGKTNGKAQGIDSDGALIVKLRNGRLRKVISSEVREASMKQSKLL